MNFRRLCLGLFVGYQRCLTSRRADNFSHVHWLRFDRDLISGK